MNIENFDLFGGLLSVRLKIYLMNQYFYKIIAF